MPPEPADALPEIAFPEDLPVSQRRDDIAEAIKAHQVVIVAGETGSGKTTQLPKIALALGRRSIAHTQPRRIAARAIAERVAAELGEEVGGLVGYQVRFTDRASTSTRIKLMTDGILLNELHRDRMLRTYDTVIVDEAHERSLNIDFLIGYLKRLLPERPDLKVVITSATIDPESFARHFADAAGRPAPIIEVSGRTYPVEVRWRPLVGEEGDDSESRDLTDGIIAALDELAAEKPGDVLVFLSGENEIRDAADAVRGHLTRTGQSATTEVLPLFGRLSAEEQHRVFGAPPPGIRRRVVLATNVAETSLTVPGIRYVVDAGQARISRYSVRAKVQRLPIEAISQASATQRSGRAGRTSDGIAIRLYSEEDFAKRPAFTEPEILRTNLASVILQMASLGLGDVESFPFLTPPDSRGVKDGVDLLTELGALSRDERMALTKVGRDLARLPIDPRFGRMLVEAKRHGVVREVMAIVAGLTVQDPRERPAERRAAADQAHSRFADPSSDFLSLLGLWNHLEERQRELSGNAFRRMCRAEFLNYLRVREWQDVYRQLSRTGKQLGLVPGAPTADPDGVHKALLAGLLSHLGLRDQQRGDYLGARGIRFAIFPGSVLAKRQPPAVMSAELVETSRLFARINASIDPAWAEPIAGDLVRRQYSEPHWERKQGAAVAYEKVTLYGVPIIERRRVQLARIDPQQARELFIRHGLVDGDWPWQRKGPLFEFDRRNRALRSRLAEVEERARRRDILRGDEAVFSFYDERIPADVVSARTFETWWRRARAETPELLTMDESVFVEPGATDDSADRFPAEWVQGERRFRLRYRFEPGAPDDGVTVEVPVGQLAEVSPAGFDWQVPGLREELVAALIRSLPKALRRSIVPAAEWAARLNAELPTPPVDWPAQRADGDRSLLTALSSAIRRLAHIPVDPSDFDLSRVPAHLLPTFAVVGERGRRLAASKDLAELQRRFAEHAAAAAPPPYDLRAELITAVPSPVPYVEQHLTAAEKLALAASPYPSTRALFDDCLRAVVDEVVEDERAAGRGTAREDFARVRDRLSASVLDAMFDTVSKAAAALAAAREAERAIGANTSLALLGALTDMRAQLAGLVFDGFVSRTGRARLAQLPRYLRGIAHRAARVADNPGRDRVWQSEVERALERFADAGGAIPLPPGAPAHLTRARWLIEELRLSLFAQPIGAAEPVSLQRIAKALAAK